MVSHTFDPLRSVDFETDISLYTSALELASCPASTYSLVNPLITPAGHDVATLIDGLVYISPTFQLRVKFNPSRTFISTYSLISFDNAVPEGMIMETIVQVIEVSFKCDPSSFTWTTAQTSPVTVTPGVTSFTLSSLTVSPAIAPCTAGFMV